VRMVLDASGAIEVALNKKLGPQITGTLADADVVLAPELFVPEVVNAIWKYHHFQQMSLPQCDQALERALGLVDTLVSNKEIWSEAFLLARTADKPAYDMFYLALARREDAALVTLDAALRRLAEGQGIRTA
jgi:predicted nucleic acid-binding protein